MVCGRLRPRRRPYPLPRTHLGVPHRTRRDLHRDTDQATRARGAAIKDTRTLRLALASLIGALVLAPATVASESRPDAIATLQARAKPIICQVFGRYCHEALRVSWCESRHYKWAQNGQYHGLFQMGYWERRRYGDAPGAWAQARAAHRYFVASGRDWSPWSCKP
jgi:hypothetical protein